MSAKDWPKLLLIVVALLALALLLPVACTDVRPLANQADSPAPAPTATPTPEARNSWVKLPPMPETATQADYGAELFRLVCRDCHGDKGQGLTYAWRATWAPKDQNCWQSKCHAPNHPPDGFEIPHYIRPIIGPGTLGAYETAADLFAHLRDDQPWYNPGSMTDEENWQLTAFLLRENDVDLQGEPLGPGRAASLPVHPDGAPELPTPMPEAPLARPWLALLIPGAAILLLGLRRLRRGARRDVQD